MNCPPIAVLKEKQLKIYMIDLFSFRFRYHTQDIYHIRFHGTGNIEI